MVTVVCYTYHYASLFSMGICARKHNEEAVESMPDQQCCVSYIKTAWLRHVSSVFAQANHLSVVHSINLQGYELRLRSKLQAMPPSDLSCRCIMLSRDHSEDAHSYWSNPRTIEYQYIRVTW